MPANMAVMFDIPVAFVGSQEAVLIVVSAHTPIKPPRVAAPDICI